MTSIQAKQPSRVFTALGIAVCAVSLLTTSAVRAQSCPGVIEVGPLVEDPATFNAIAFSLPITSGDNDYDASVSVRFRPQGAGVWQNAQNMLRVRPETISTDSPPPSAHEPILEQFAGSIMGLTAGATYEVELNLVDPDGCDETIATTASTRPMPPSNPASPNNITVNSFAELQNAVDNATAGDVITLAAGTHTAPFTGDEALNIQNVVGTFDNPIIIRGEDRHTTILDGNGNKEVIYTRDTEYLYIEDLTIRNGEYGVRLYGDSIGTVVQGNIIRDITIGIWAKNWVKRDITICDNDLRGGVVFPQNDSSTWDFEGIVFHGSGGVICHNTIAGFGDALGFSKAQEADSMPPHRGNDIFGNDVLWGGDDCIEFDYSERNNRAFNNRCTNTANGISFQPVFGGPAYAYNNIVYNPQKYSVLKPNNRPSGIAIYHNLLSLPWLNYAGSAFNVDMRNNLFVGIPDDIVTDVSTRLLAGSESERAIIENNAWSYDGRFRLGRGIDTWSSLADMQSGGLFGDNSLILGQHIFEDASWPLRRDPGEFSPAFDNFLHAQSDAVDAGVVLPNINDGYNGAAPDIGPFEVGDSKRIYGARWLAGVKRPGAPSGLSID